MSISNIIYNHSADQKNPCTYCGETSIVIGGGRVWCANEPCSAELDGNIRVGLIEGRHSMPVDCYLMEADATDAYGYHQGMYDAAYQAAIDFGKAHGGFSLYVTGLTVAALGAVAGMRAAGIKSPIVMNYDKDSETYVKITTHGL